MPTKKMAVAPKVAALLRRVEKRILEEPRRFDMANWIYRPSLDSPVQRPACGTVGCIAGWIALDGMSIAKIKKLTPRQLFALGEWHSKKGVAQIAAKAVGVPLEHAVSCVFPNAHPLFTTRGWPEKYRDAYEVSPTPRGRARVAVRRIEHFIKTGE